MLSRAAREAAEGVEWSLSRLAGDEGWEDILSVSLGSICVEVGCLAVECGTDIGGATIPGRALRVAGMGVSTANGILLSYIEDTARQDNECIATLDIEWVIPVVRRTYEIVNNAPSPLGPFSRLSGVLSYALQGQVSYNLLYPFLQMYDATSTLPLEAL